MKYWQLCMSVTHRFFNEDLMVLGYNWSIMQY